MMREALDRLDRRANEHERSFGKGQIQLFWYSSVTETTLRMGMEGEAILKSKELAGGDDGTRTRDLMRDSSKPDGGKRTQE